MPSKKLPFGYGFEAGKIVVIKDEVELIRRVFSERIEGITGTKIGERLYSEGIPYFSENVKKSADKVYCILRNERYYGAESYPPIITEDTFRRAKGSMYVKTFGKPVDTYTFLKKMSYCTECGRNMVHSYNGLGAVRWHCTTKGCANYMPMITDEEYISEVISILNAVTETPYLIDMDIPLTEYAPDIEVLQRENSINVLLSSQPIDAQQIRSEILALTEIKYNCCTYSRIPHITEDLKAVIGAYSPSDTINIEMLKQTADRITVDENKKISIVFKNGKSVSLKGK